MRGAKTKNKQSSTSSEFYQAPFFRLMKWTSRGIELLLNSRHVFISQRRQHCIALGSKAILSYTIVSHFCLDCWSVLFILNQTQNKPLRFMFATNLLNCVDIGKCTYSCHLQLALESKTDHRAIINSYHQTDAIILALVMILLPMKFMDAFIKVTHYCLHICT